ncbi:troponin I-like [Gymnodraco acuticeps]|uniref:Troponin I-like n=1 Tax=Gymnodraco acuticeps TaxID=8218 RepID=A0A6P8UR38_GYMAC|nr:troponin I-like [Gymnodraco acuticeps]
MSDVKKMTSSRRHHLKSLILQIAAGWIEEENKELIAAKEAYMSENAPNPDLGGDMAALQELCKKLHQALDKIDDSRYDAESKVKKSNLEIEDLKMKVVDLVGVKKPALKKVRMSADAMLQALLGGKHKVTMDLRSNLKQVKKEVKEETPEALDWRKNIDDKADRKKMFETGVERKHATMTEKKMTSSRRHALKSLILTIAAKWLDEEKAADIAAKEEYMTEHCVKPSMSGDQAALMETCKKLHALLDKLDEERYDLASKVGKADKEIEDLNIKVVDLRGVKKPALRKVRMSADAMLKALLGSKHSVNMDLRANLKQVKKEVKEEPQEAAGDWRKNVEDKADRKKMFEAT